MVVTLRRELGPQRGIDGLICNAGALLNKRTLTKEGLETTFACHLLCGSYLLTELCIPLLKRSSDPRVVLVSSGGMYNFGWSGSLFLGPFSGNSSNLSACFLGQNGKRQLQRSLMPRRHTTARVPTLTPSAGRCALIFLYIFYGMHVHAVVGFASGKVGRIVQQN